MEVPVERWQKTAPLGGCFRRPFHRALTRGPCRFKLVYGLAPKPLTVSSLSRWLFSDIL
jgi:hypothetical protein